MKEKNWVVYLYAGYWFYNIPLDFLFHMSGDMHNQLLFIISAGFGYAMSLAILPSLAKASKTYALVYVLSLFGSQIPQFWNGIPESFLTHPNGADPHFYILHIVVHAGLLVNTWCVFEAFRHKTTKVL